MMGWQLLSVQEILEVVTERSGNGDSVVEVLLRVLGLPNRNLSLVMASLIITGFGRSFGRVGFLLAGVTL